MKSSFVLRFFISFCALRGVGSGPSLLLSVCGSLVPVVLEKMMEIDLYCSMMIASRQDREKVKISCILTGFNIY